MNKSLLTSFLATFLLLIVSCNQKTEANSSNEVLTESTTFDLKSNADVVVIQFHNENRCKTCMNIERLSKASISEGVDFQLLNVEDSTNEAAAEFFEASGTALFLYNPKTKDKKDLTDFAFMNANDEEKFTSELKSEIEAFKTK